MKKGQKGKPHSIEAKERHRQAVLGKNHPMWGKHHTEESNKKKSAASINMWKNPNSRVNTKEYREILSKSLSGKNHPMYGNHNTTQSNEKRRKTMLAHWENINSIYNTESYKEKRKDIVKNMNKFKKYENTKLELKFKKILNELNIQYEFQKWISPYRVDFYIPICNLIIEADGKWAHGDPRKYKPTDIIQRNQLAKDKWESDKKRNIFLESLGYNVIRFWEKEIISDPNLVKELIKVALIKYSYPET